MTMTQDAGRGGRSAERRALPKLPADDDGAGAEASRGRRDDDGAGAEDAEPE